MRSREQDINAVKNILHGGHTVIAWSEGSGGEVFRIWNTLLLYEIPRYGGEGLFSEIFLLHEIEKLVDSARSWT